MPTIPTTPAAGSAPAAEPAREAGATLGKDDFLKLFVTQLQYQNPMQPMQDTEFIGQMASFSTLEQVSKLAEANEQLAARLELSGALGFLGRTVTYTAGDGAEQTGVVERVAVHDGRQVLTVGGTAGVEPSAITAVA